MKINNIYSGDCIEILNKTIKKNSINLVFADPPYNLQLRETLYRPDQTTVEAVTNDWDKFDTIKSLNSASSSLAIVEAAKKSLSSGKKEKIENHLILL